MKCHVRGSKLALITTDLPFKVGDSTIVILKGLPLLQCGNCAEFLIEDSVMSRVEEIVAGVDTAAELEVISYAA